jgi:uncharacterized protein
VTLGPAASKADVAAVAAMLGRSPAGQFSVVVRRTDGSPVVIRNAPALDDGTPMPTLLWLVDPALTKQVSTIESHGGVRRLEQAVDPAALAAAHADYAARRDALLANDQGPTPSGGVGGTRVGVKCLHAHLANFLAGADDPVGSAVADEVDLGVLVPPPPTRDRLSS